VLVCTLISIELIFYSKILNIFSVFILLLKKNYKVISLNNVSDHWKQKLILAVALRVAKKGIILIFLIAIIIGPFLLVYFFKNDFLNFIISTRGALQIIILSFFYYLIRRSFVPK